MLEVSMRRFHRLFLCCLLVLTAFPWPLKAQNSALFNDAYGFTTYWNQANGARVFGQPVTGLVDSDGKIVQYFEHARMEYEATTGEITLGLLGRERTQWRMFAPQPPVGGNVRRFADTAYVLSGSFRIFWEENGALEIFGLPISAAFWEQTPSGRLRVQYFERAKFIHHPLYIGTDREIELAPLGREVAASRGLIEGGIAQPQAGMFSYDPVPPAPPVTAPPAPPAAPEATAVPQPTVAPQPTAVPEPAPQPTAVPEPTPAPQPTASSGRWIDVNISTQWLYAYEGDTIVFDAPIATGKDGFNTPTGTYSIYAKVPLQTMRGSIGGESWVVPNVPHAMYFNGGVALHGTYWHNLFGSGVRISHGCVNLPLDAAAWLYDWASVGTTVVVHF